MGKENWKIIYFQKIDAVIVNLKYCFSDESLVLANSLDQFIKMDFEVIKPNLVNCIYKYLTSITST